MKKVSAREAVVAALGDLGSASAKSLVSYTKKPKPQVATTLWKLKRDGKVSVKDGTYKLVWGPIKLKLDPTPSEAPDSFDQTLASMTADQRHIINLEEYIHEKEQLLDDAMAVIKYLEGKLGSVHA